MAESCAVITRSLAAAAMLPATNTARLHNPLPLSSRLLIRPSQASSPLRCRRLVGSPSPVRYMSASASASSPEESVKRTVAENPVVVYSKTWCSYSMEVKALFKRIGVEPYIVELDQLGAQGRELQDVLEAVTGQYTVPNVFIGGKHIGGCTDTLDLYHKGELTDLLEKLNLGSKNLEQP